MFCGCVVVSLKVIIHFFVKFDLESYSSILERYFDQMLLCVSHSKHCEAKSISLRQGCHWA